MPGVHSPHRYQSPCSPCFKFSQRECLAPAQAALYLARTLAEEVSEYKEATGMLPDISVASAEPTGGASPLIGADFGLAAAREVVSHPSEDGRSERSLNKAHVRDFQVTAVPAHFC